MPDKRPVDELSIEELERILAIRKREARQKQLQRMQRSGRVVTQQPSQPVAPNLPANPVPSNSAPPNPLATSNAPRFEDDVQAISYRSRKRKNDTPQPEDEDSRIWRTFVDRTMFLVEIAAVVGLIVLGGTMLSNIDILQRETANAQAEAEQRLRASIPTIEPTPQLQLANIVLPGGHTPPTEAGGGQFNFDEIPANLRALVRDQIFLPPEIERPPTTPETPLRIIIPDINVDHVIVQGVDWEALKLGVGQLPNGVTPTEGDGNVVLAAHNDIYGEIFRYLDQLEPGMQFQIQTQSAYHTYQVRETRVVEPSAVEVMESQGLPMATLISCYPYQVNTQRIVVFADKLE
jgi:sortase A